MSYEATLRPSCDGEIQRVRPVYAAEPHLVEFEDETREFSCRGRGFTKGTFWVETCEVSLQLATGGSCSLAAALLSVLMGDVGHLFLSYWELRSK